MITKSGVDKGLEYFEIPSEYKDVCYRCLEVILSNPEYIDSFEKTFNFLNFGQIDDLKKCWGSGVESKLLCNGIHAFATNLMVIAGYKTCEKTIALYHFGEEMSSVLKNRVRFIFESDIKKFGMDGIRYTQMSWAYYLIRGRVVESGRLQYENFDNQLVKIHIPGGNRLDFESVVQSLETSKYVTENIFGLSNADYICESWLLSNQIAELVNPESNLGRFYNLFEVQDGEDCLSDVLYQVFSVFDCKNYNQLPEDTSLRKKVKERLLDNKSFKLGIGKLIKKKVM